MRVLLLCIALSGAIWAELSLNSDDIKSVIDGAKTNFEASNIEFENERILAISDVENISGFEVNGHLMVRLFINKILQPANFKFTKYMGSGDVFTKDPMLDKSRSERENDEFQNFIPKNSLIVPQYSLTTKISSITRLDDDNKIIEYIITFTITDLKTGLVVWDYIAKVDKDSANSSLQMPQRTQDSQDLQTMQDSQTSPKISNQKPTKSDDSQKPSQVESNYELDGIFLGANVGISGAKICNSDDDDECDFDDYTSSKIAPAYGLVLGYKHFFKFVGLRYYLSFAYSEAAFEKDIDKARYYGFGGNIDLLGNFYNGSNFIFGGFVGLGVGYQNIELQGKLNAKTNGFDMWLNAGIRSVIYQNHGLELGLKVPFMDTKISNTKGRKSNDRLHIRENLGVFVGYSYSFSL